MTDPTPNLGLKKIDYGSDHWDDDEHTNADKIDAAATSIGTDEVALSIMQGASFSSNANPYSLPSGVNTWLPMGVRSDPRGWASAAPVVSAYNGGTVPIHSALTLPKGVYLAGTDIVYNSAPHDLRFGFDWVDDPATTDVVYGDPGGFFTPFFGMRDALPAAATLGDFCSVGMLRITQAMATAGLRVAPRALQSTGSPKLFNYWDLFIVRVA